MAAGGQHGAARPASGERSVRACAAGRDAIPGIPALPESATRVLLGRVLDSPSAYALAALAALCIGLSKAGFSGISLVSVFLMADLYGAKPSVGITLPLLIVADLTVYPAFIRHGSWKPVWRLLPATLAGIGAGWW